VTADILYVHVAAATDSGRRWSFESEASPDDTCRGFRLLIVLTSKAEIQKTNKDNQMMDDLQTLCAAALRRHYVRSASDCDDENENNSGWGSSSSNNKNITAPLTMDWRVIECVKMTDKPLLQIEAMRVLVDAFDAGLTPQQRKEVDFGALVDLCGSSDEAIRNKAGAVLGGIVNGTSEELQSVVFEPMVEGVLGDDPESQLVSTERFGHLLSILDDPPLQRTIDSGVVPRFVEFLQPEDDDFPSLQLAAVQALMLLAMGTPDRARVVFFNDATRSFVRLLQSLDEHVRGEAAFVVAMIAEESPDFRDFLLRDGALPPLLREAGRTPEPRYLGHVALAISKLCSGDTPPPPLALVRPALPTLAKLLLDSNEEVVLNAALAFGSVSHWPADQTREVVAAGVCRRVVELLHHPCSEIQ
jgi:hypothetical protein